MEHLKKVDLKEIQLFVNWGKSEIQIYFLRARRNVSIAVTAQLLSDELDIYETRFFDRTVKKKKNKNGR